MADDRDRVETTEPEARAAESEAAPRAAARRAARRPAPRARASRRADADDVSAPRARARRAARARAEAPADDAPAEERVAARRAAARRASSRRREAAEAPARTLVVRAQARYVRSSARKARLVCDHIRGKSVDEARAILAFTPRAVARDWSKVLESAVANAEHNHELDGEDLLVKAAHADEGPTLKRFRPRAMGRATPIRKRTSHLTILLAPKE